MSKIFSSLAIAIAAVIVSSAQDPTHATPNDDLKQITDPKSTISLQVIGPDISFQAGINRHHLGEVACEYRLSGEAKSARAQLYKILSSYGEFTEPGFSLSGDIGDIRIGVRAGTAEIFLADAGTFPSGNRGAEGALNGRPYLWAYEVPSQIRDFVKKYTELIVRRRHC